MWNSLAREVAKRIGGTIVANKMAGVEEPNGPEAYADRIKRDFHLHDYADAWALYDSDRPYWENYYRPRPNGPANNEFVRDSAAAAGVPGRNNVFEYGFPEFNSVRPSMGEPPSLRIPNGPAWNNAFIRDSASAAGIPSRYNVFEHGFPESSSVPAPISEAPSVRKLSTWYVRPDGSTVADSLAGRMSRPAAIDPSNAGWPAPSPSTGFGGANGDVPPSRFFDTGTSPIPNLPLASQQAPRGLPALLAEIGAFDSSNPEASPSGGLPGLIQEYLRNR